MRDASSSKPGAVYEGQSQAQPGPAEILDPNAYSIQLFPVGKTWSGTDHKMRGGYLGARASRGQGAGSLCGASAKCCAAQKKSKPRFWGNLTKKPRVNQIFLEHILRPIQNLLSSLSGHFGMGVKLTSKNIFFPISVLIHSI